MVQENHEKINEVNNDIDLKDNVVFLHYDYVVLTLLVQVGNLNELNVFVTQKNIYKTL